jgi:hypothetical protein
MDSFEEDAIEAKGPGRSLRADQALATKIERIS